MTTRQHRLDTPVIAGPKEKTQWALDELTAVVRASCDAQDVVSPGPVVPGRKGLGAHGSVHVRRGWRLGVIVAVAARPSLANAVLVAVIPTSKLQNWLYVALFGGGAVAGLVGGYAWSDSAALGMSLVGFFAGLVVAILPAICVQYFGLGVARDSSAVADRLSADIGRWIDERGTRDDVKP